MSTQVLLMKDVQNLGSEGDVVNVSDGYARNYLFPRGLAAPVTEATKRKLAKMQKDREAERIKAVAEAKEIASRLSGISVTIPVKTGGAEKLYGSVGPSDIVKALADNGITIDRHSVEMDHHIKDLGVFDVKIKLHPEVESTIKVWVVEE